MTDGIEIPVSTTGESELFDNNRTLTA